MFKPFNLTIAHLIVSLSATLVVVFLMRLGFFDKPEFTTYDFRFRYRGVEPPDPNVVIVKIDDQSQQELGLWPFPRSYHAKLVRNLKRAGAKVIVFDIEFFNPTDDDALLAQAMREAGNVLIAKKAKSKDENIWSLPAPLLREAAYGLVNIDMVPDSDSFIRRALLIEGEESGHNSYLAAEAVSLFLNAPSATFSSDRRYVRIGDLQIPIDHRGSMVINYAAPTGIGLFPGYAYSYAQILDSESDWGIKPLIEGGFLKDKIVLIGATYEDAHDIYPTPFFLGTGLLTSKRKILMPGVEVHANIIRTLLRRAFITRLGFYRTVLLIFLLSLLVGLMMIRFRPLVAILLVAGVFALYVVGAVYLFVHQRRWIDIAAPSGGIFLTYVGAVMYRFFAERKQKERIRGAFSHYVPRSVVNELIRHPEMLQLGGEERELSVLFSDVEGFTTISEGLTPTELRALLDEYLTPMTDIILKYSGIIDKYEGDAIMAEFGAPLPLPDHARRACFAAIEMQQQLSELRRRWARENKPLLRCRIGISSGPMVIGNMGSQDIFDYTVIGDSVNVASRLEGANKEYGTYVMISEQTYEQVKQEVVARELDIIRVKGKREPVRGYELLSKASDGLPEHRHHMIEQFLRGLEAYKAWDWDEAIACFRAALELAPEDGPCHTYLRRCQVFKQTPPPSDWDGVYILPTA